MVTITTYTVVKVNNKIDLSVRALRKANRDRGMLYRAIRKLAGLSQGDMAKVMNTTRDALIRREHTKRLYSVPELNALQRVSGLSDVEWCELLRQIAK